MALWESLTVVAVGVFLGALTAAGAVFGVSAAVSDIVGAPVRTVPWELACALGVTAAVVVAAATVVTARGATRHAAIAVAGASE